jgi:type I restriction enzyme S subunit
MDFDESEQKLYGLRPGDILMCEGGEIGRCAIWDSDRRCFYQKALHRLRPTTDKDDPRHFVLVMRAAVEAGLFSSRASAATIQHLPAEKLRVVRYPAPPIEEQRAIVDRVSRQTARLDALVAAKQRLIDLLAEKRKAIIATAVTRGLDPKVKLRDSGVPWLGKIPAHWSTPPVYARYEVQLGKMLDERQITKRFLAPYLRNTDVQWDGINVDDLPEMDFDASEQKLYALRPGDILMCEGGEIGRCAIWDGDRRCFYQKALHRLRPTSDKDDSRYFVSVMRAAVDAGLFASRASAATIQHLPAEKLRIVRYAAPPIEEQRTIVEHIAHETAKLDAVRAATERTIVLLKERRSALIAAAVTGQLDVGAAA